MRTVKTTRKFEGKTYKLHDWYLYKPAAQVAAGIQRSRGYLVRLTLRLKSKKPGGYPLYDLWYLWKRKV